jgi:hypothetical protein
MTISETLYTARFRAPDTIARATNQTIECPTYRLGAVATPTSGTVSVYRADQTVVVNAAAVSIAPGSWAKYTISGGVTSPLQLEEGWLIEWTLTMPDMLPHVFRQDAALVRRELAPVVTDADLIRRHSDLPQLLATGVTTFQDYLDEAWATIMLRVIANGRRPYLVISPSAFRDVHLLLTLHFIFLDFQTSAGDGSRWQALADYYRAAYTEAYGQLSFVYDESDTNKVDPTHRKSGSSQVWLNGRGSGNFYGLRGY